MEEDIMEKDIMEEDIMEEDIKRILKIYNNMETEKADKVVLYKTGIKDIVNVLERLEKENKDIKDENNFLKKTIQN